MRKFIFTERERRLLRKWLETGEENGETLKVLSWIRKRWPMLAEDMTLLFETIKAMQRQQRWRERMTKDSEFGSVLRRAESALTRAKRGRTTSDASSD